MKKMIACRAARISSAVTVWRTTGERSNTRGVERAIIEAMRVSRCVVTTGVCEEDAIAPVALGDDCGEEDGGREGGLSLEGVHRGRRAGLGGQ